MMMPTTADHATLSVYQTSHDQVREQLGDAARAAVEPDSRFPRGQLPRYLPHDPSPATSRRVRIRAQRGPLWARTAQGDGR